MISTLFAVSAHSFRRTVYGLLAVMAMAAPLNSSAQSTQQSRIVSPVDNAARTHLPGSTPPLVKISHDLGALPDSTPANRMLLVLKHSQGQQLQLDQTLADLQNSKSASYHHWLTPEAFAARFGPSDSDLQTINGWLASQGFAVNKVSKGHSAIEFSGTMAQVRNAFHAELHRYIAPDGRSFNANSSDVQIPAALASVVAGVAALNNIPAQAYSHIVGSASFNSKTHEAKPLNAAEWSYPLSDGGVYLVTAPSDLAVQYDINPIYAAGSKGDGEIIGIVSQAGIDETMVANYRALFGLSATNLPVEIVDGADPGIDGDQAGGEANLDVDVAGSTAPNASLYVYTAGDSSISLGLFNASIRAVDDDVADILSVSYGICEPALGLSGNLFFNELWSQAAAQGQTVIVSSGDSGGAGCDNRAESATHGLTVSGMTSTPYNLSVGGTDFYYGAYGTSGLSAIIHSYWNTTASAAPATSLLKTIPEQPWNDAFGLNIGGPPATGTTAAGSGGPSSCVTGISGPPSGPLVDPYQSCTAGTPKPGWQSAPGVPNDGVRDVPDISLFAANGANYSFYPICAVAGDCTAATADPTTGAMQITGIGGTSASTPLMAGIMALIDQSLKGRQGNVNFILYPLANSTPSVFHDVTLGNNDVNCTKGTPDCILDPGGFYSFGGYSAGPGYDLASGLGSIDANALLTHWNGPSFATTSTSLSVSPLSFAHGTPVTLTSVVTSSSGTPMGIVSLVSNSTATTQAGLGTMGLTHGTAQATLNSLPAGTYQIYARYGGDGTFASSLSDPITLTVTPESSKIAVTGTYYGFDSQGNSIPSSPVTDNMNTFYGGAFVIDARIYGASSTAAAPDGLPTGSVTVLDNGVAFTTLSLSASGMVELQTTSLGAGTHSLTFSYSGDGSFNSVTSQPLHIAIAKGTGEVALSLGIPNKLPVGARLIVPVQVETAGYGQLPLTGSVTVTFGSQTQTVTNLQQSDFQGFLSTAFGSVTFDTSQAGAYNLNATYSGDANLNPITTAFNPSTINIFTSSLATTTATLSLSANTLGNNDTVYATVKVTGGTRTPTSYVGLYLDGNPDGAEGTYEPLDATGTVVLPIRSSAIFGDGNIQVLAVYIGDAYNATSMSNPQMLTVTSGEFLLTAARSVVSMPAGASGTSTIGIGLPVGTQLSGAVALSCAVSSPVLGCSLAQSSVTMPSDPTHVATTILTVTSQAGAMAGLTVPRLHGRGTLSVWASSGALLALCLWLAPASRRRRLPMLTVLMAMMAGATLSLTGCGQKHSITQLSSTNTPSPNAGAYTVTVTANYGGIIKKVLIRVVLK